MKNGKVMRKIRKYLYPPLREYAAPAICAALSVLAAVMDSFLTGAFAFFAIAFAVFPLMTIVRAESSIGVAEDDGDKMPDDFEHGEMLCGDNMRMGDKYVFGRGSGVIIPYDVIEAVYQRVEKSPFMEGGRELKVRTSDGKVHTVCRLRRKGRSDDDVKRAADLILAHNPEAEAGYRLKQE